MALSAKAQARSWQVLFAVVAIIGLGLFAAPGGTPFAIAMTSLGTIGWFAVTAILNYHKK